MTRMNPMQEISNARCECKDFFGFENTGCATGIPHLAFRKTITSKNIQGSRSENSLTYQTYV